MFNLEQSIIYPALRWQKIFQLVKTLRVIFWLAIVALLVLLIPGIEMLPKAQVEGWLIVVLIFAISSQIKSWFFASYLTQRPLAVVLADAINDQPANLADYLDFESAQIIQRAQTKIKQPTDFDQILLSELLTNEKIVFALARTGIVPQDFVEASKLALKPGPLPELIINQAGQSAVSHQRQRIELTDLLASISLQSPLFKQVLFNKDLDDNDVANVAAWISSLLSAKFSQPSWWRRAAQGLAGVGIGKSWTAGWTYYLDQFVFDVTRAMSEGKKYPHVFGYQRELESLEQFLSGARQNNVILVGEPGVGKKTLVHWFAWRSLNGQNSAAVVNKRVLELDVDALLSGVRQEGEIRDRLSLVLKEAARAGNVVLFIDQIHRLLNVEGVGSLDVSLILSPYLQGTEMQLIGATDYQHYHSLIERRPDLQKLMEKIEVNPPSKQETILILEDLALSLEQRYGVIVTYQAIRAAVNLADRFIQTTPFPEKAIDVLEQALILAQKTNEPMLDTSLVEKALSQKVEAPIGQARGEEQAKLMRLEKIVHERIVNQVQAVSQVVASLQRSRAGIANPQRPIGAFLFLGPTGVGKTETAKAIAEAYFGSDKRMIRLDMTEYQNVNDLEKFLGSVDGSIPGQLTDKIREDPFSLVLLDEIEKAHPKILNLFLQVLDEGRLTDAQGRLVSFLSTIIIATSNAGSEMIREYVAQCHPETPVVIASPVRNGISNGARSPESNEGLVYPERSSKGGNLELDFQKKLLDYLQQQGIFAPEWLNRFDAAVVYEPLSPENLLAVARLMLANLTKRVLAERDISLEFSDEAIQKIAQLGYDPQFGARPMRRVIQDRIETKLAQRILAGELKRGDTMLFNIQDI